MVQLLITFAVVAYFGGAVTNALAAEDCFIESPNRAGKPTLNSVSFSDKDILTGIYQPGMEVKAFVACYDEDFLPKKLISLRPLVGVEGGDETYQPLTKLGKPYGACEMWLGRGSFDKIWKIWLPQDISYEFSMRIYTVQGVIETFGQPLGVTVNFDVGYMTLAGFFG